MDEQLDDNGAEGKTPPPERDWRFARGLVNAATIELFVGAAIERFWPAHQRMSGILFWSAAALGWTGVLLMRRK